MISIFGGHMDTARELRERYAKGENISAHLRSERGAAGNTREIIEVTYDLQAGSYIAAMQDAAHAAYKRDYCKALAETILSLCVPTSILEAGVGEATTLAGLLPHLPAINAHGFDLSWSRVAYASRWLEQQQQRAALCTGDLVHIPFANESIDIVYTSHSIEPNAGNEKPILQELYRVARRFVVLLEPGYELAGEDARRRMDQHGYCRDLPGVASSLGHDVLEHRLFQVSASPLNPTALTVIRKNSSANPPNYVLACPRYGTTLQEIGGMLYSAEAAAVYPVLGGIPCLRIENGILASHFPELHDLSTAA